MVDCCGCPGHYAVAVTAVCGCNDVTRGFARCIDAVVTIAAAAGHTAMVERGRQPCIGSMAIATVQRRHNMIHCFTGRHDAIVTTSAATDYLRMIDAQRRRPTLDRVAGFASISSRDV